MGQNRGKQFEDVVKKSFKEVKGISIDRVHDQMSGFAGSTNISDFILYRQPYEYYIECKCCYGNTLNFHNITDTQWLGMLAKSKIKGVKAGVIVWFIDHDVTYYISIQDLEIMKKLGMKSVPVTNFINDVTYREIRGKKKKIFFVYDMELLLDDIDTNYREVGSNHE